MSINEKLKIIEDLINKGHFNEAQAKLADITSLEDFSENEQIEYQLLKSSYLCKIGKFEESLELAKEVSEKTNIGKNVLYMMNSLLIQEEVLWRLGKYDKSLELIKQGQEIIANQDQEEQWKEIEAHLLRHEGAVYQWKGEWDESLRITKQALKLAEEIGNKTEIAYCINNIASIYSQKGDLDKVLEYYNRNLDYHKEIGNKYDIARDEHNLGITYFQMGHWNKSLNYFNKSIDFFKEIDNQYMIASCYGMIGYVYLNTGRWDEAIEYGQKSLELGKKIGIKEEIADSLFLIFSTLLLPNSLEAAQKYLTQLKEINEEIADKANSQRISQRYRYAKALFLMRGDRITEKVKAQEILQQLVTEDIFYSIDHFYMMLDLCTLLLSELKSYGKKVVFDQIKNLLGQMEEIANKNKSSDLILKTQIFRARLSLVEGDVQNAEVILEQAKEDVTEVDSVALKNWINHEIRRLYKELSRWDDILKQNLPLKERVDYARLEEYVTQASRFWQEI
jgi:tetratricopeptide (TPR) repeat protein